MPSIFEFLPDDLKNSFIENNLKIGSVLRIHVNNTNPPKIKRFIIVGFSDDKVTIAATFINTEINTNVFKNNYLKNLQIELEEEGREYLDHNSFVDCSNVFERDYEGLKSVLENNPDCNIGTIDEEDMKKIKHKLSIATTISDSIKKKYDLEFKILSDNKPPSQPS